MCPIYEYECKSCGAKEAYLKSISWLDSEEAKGMSCPNSNCKEGKLERVLSSGFIRMESIRGRGKKRR